MRIGIDVRVADPSGPGQERYLWRLGAWLAGRGHEVHYLSLRPQRDSVTLHHSTVLHRLHGASSAEARKHLSGLSLEVLVLNPERSGGYHGIPANVLRPAYGTDHYRQKLRSFRDPGERALRQVLRWTPWELAARRRERGFYERTGTWPEVIAQSAYLKREIVESYSIPEEHVHVVHNGIDLHEFSVDARRSLREEMRLRWGIGRDAVCLLVLAHNFRLKGLWRLFDVLGSRPGMELVHVLVAGKGTGPGQRRAALQRAKRAGIGERVTLAGPVQPPLHALAAADALVHLSWHDAFGLAPLEAMACGLPVVTTRFAGVSELIDDRVSGLIVDPESDEEIASALRELATPDRRMRVGLGAAHCAATHDEADCYADIERVIETAVVRGGPLEL